jgi:hypothetical protein
MRRRKRRPVAWRPRPHPAAPNATPASCEQIGPDTRGGSLVWPVTVFSQISQYYSSVLPREGPTTIKVYQLAVPSGLAVVLGS